MPTEETLTDLQVGAEVTMFVQNIDREVLVHLDIHIPETGPTSTWYGSVVEDGAEIGREVIIKATRTDEGFSITATAGQRRVTRWVSA